MDNLSQKSTFSTEQRPSDFTFVMPGALPLESIALAYERASIRGKSPVTVTTAPQQWTYAASIPIVLDRTPGLKRLIHIRGRVSKGQIGLGILSRKNNAFQVEKFVDPTPDVTDFYIPISAADQADDLIVRNVSPTGTVSEITIINSEILAPAHRIPSCARLEEASVANTKAQIKLAGVLSVTTAPEQWAYAAAIPVHSPAERKGVVLKIRARVGRGEIGFGLLSADEKSFVVEQRYGPSENPIDLFLPLPSASGVSKLVIRNTAANRTASTAIVESVETWKLD
jgi:hypothetical protein